MDWPVYAITRLGVTTTGGELAEIQCAGDFDQPNSQSTFEFKHLLM
jgi:hypothetical protein